MAECRLRIVSLNFNEYRCFTRYSIKFAEGRNTISGENSSGKTTIISTLKSLLLENSEINYSSEENYSKDLRVKLHLIFDDDEYSIAARGDADSLQNFSLTRINDQDDGILSEHASRQILKEIRQYVTDLDAVWVECCKEAEESKYHRTIGDIWMKDVGDKLPENHVIIGEPEWFNLDGGILNSDDWNDFQGVFDFSTQSILTNNQEGESPYNHLIHLWSQKDLKELELLKNISERAKLTPYSEELFFESTIWNRSKKVSANTEIDLDKYFAESKYLLVNISENDINGIILKLAKSDLRFIVILESRNSYTGRFFGIISQEPVGSTLVAKFDDTFDESAFLNAFNSNQNCSVKSFGMWIDSTEFYGMDSILASNEIEQLVVSSGFTRYGYQEFVINHKFGKSLHNGTDFIELPNSVFISTVAPHEDAFCLLHHEIESLMQKNGKLLGSWVQLQLSPEVTHCEYVALLLNGVQKSKYFKLLSYNGKINVRNLQELFFLYVPSIEKQHQISDYYNQLIAEISDKKQMIDELKMPGFSIDDLDHYDKLDWIKDIPYPLASILQTYRSISEKDADKRMNHLLYFFEAFSQFIASVHLSAWSKSNDWDKVWNIFTEKQLKQGNPVSKSLHHPTFGFWNRVNNKFRKMNNRGDADMSIYSGLGDEFWQMLKSSELTNLLDSCATIRNNTKGHGVITNRSAQPYLEKLTKSLHSLRNIIHKPFAIVKMIRPGLGQMKSKYECEVELLTGISTPFRKKRLHFVSPPNASSDYLTNPGSEEALPLAPFLKRGAHMENYEYSYYFYSRKTEKGIAYNNYHSTIEGTKVTPLEDNTPLMLFLEGLSK